MSELYIRGRIQVNDKPAALDRVVRADKWWTSWDLPGWPGRLPPPGLPQIRTCGLPHPAPRVTGLPRKWPSLDAQLGSGEGSALANAESVPTGLGSGPEPAVLPRNASLGAALPYSTMHAPKQARAPSDPSALRLLADSDGR